MEKIALNSKIDLTMTEPQTINYIHVRPVTWLQDTGQLKRKTLWLIKPRSDFLLKDVGFLGFFTNVWKGVLVSTSYKYLCITSTLRKVLLCTPKHKSCL